MGISRLDLKIFNTFNPFFAESSSRREFARSRPFRLAAREEEKSRRVNNKLWEKSARLFNVL